ncbi:unnamed protein product [Cunninghamella blakesleeana]
MPDKPNHCHLYKRTSISGSSDNIRQRRLAINDTLRKKHREQLITAKRYRHLTRKEEYESAGESEPEDHEQYMETISEHDKDIDPYYRLNTMQVQSLAYDLSSSEKNIRMEAIQYLGKFVLEPAEALLSFIIEGSCIETLTRLLTGTEMDEQIRVVQTISNIAAGPYDIWIKSISTIPYLINLLDSENVTLREMAAGALGNMAAEDLGDMTKEDDEVRSRIRNNGAILPLIRMLDSNESSTIQSACFALANLARGEESELKTFITAGIGPKLLHHLSKETADTIPEIAWVMSFLTAGSNEFRVQVAQDPQFVQVLIKVLNKLSSEGVIVLPILRTLGNLAGESDEIIELLVQQTHFLPTVVKLATTSDIKVVKKEALWVMSNITSGKRSCIIEQVDTEENILGLTELIHSGHFDIRKGAATCLLNIAYHGQKYMDSLPNRSMIKSFLDFIKSQDAELIRLGLAYIDLLLTRVTRGKEILDDTPNCMDALASVNPSPDPELYAIANKLVDQYYDERNDPSMEV